MLDVSDIHLLPLDNEEEVFDLPWTYLFRPPHITQRIVAQDGWFTLHRYLEEKNKFIALENQSRFNKQLTKYVLPDSVFNRVKQRLEQLGISDYVLFPDLSNLSKQLQERVFPTAD